MKEVQMLKSVINLKKKHKRKNGCYSKDRWFDYLSSFLTFF